MTPPTGLDAAAELRQLITQAILDAAAANPASDEAHYTAEALAWRITATIHQHQAENASLRYDLAIQQDQNLKHIDHQQQRINRLPDNRPWIRATRTEGHVIDYRPDKPGHYRRILINGQLAPGDHPITEAQARSTIGGTQIHDITPPPTPPAWCDQHKRRTHTHSPTTTGTPSDHTHNNTRMAP